MPPSASADWMGIILRADPNGASEYADGPVYPIRESQRCTVTGQRHMSRAA